MKNSLCFLLILLAMSCQKSTDTVLPEYADWYTLKSPADKSIDGIWGDIDKTLLLTSNYTVFRSTDRGQNWQPVYRPSSGPVGVLSYRDTLFMFTGEVNQTLGKITRSLWANVQAYSTDDGQIWKPYRTYNPAFDWTLSTGPNSLLLFNPVTALTGSSYKINQVFLEDSTFSIRHFETPGVITSDKRRIDLPQLHQLKSLYLDSKQHLYICGSDAVCGRGQAYGQKFAFCNSRGGRGVVYVSKKPLP